MSDQKSEGDRLEEFFFGTNSRDKPVEKTKEKKKYGFWSTAAANAGGSAIYARPDGTEVEITALYDNPEGKTYMWEDKRCIGEITHYLRQGLRNT